MLKFPIQMATIFPFQPYCYTPKAGPLEKLVTQPYDKISPAMRTRYLALSPYNLVRVILGERKDSDSTSDNVYTRAAGHLDEWIGQGVLARETEPSLYAYFQEFCVPDTGEKLLRKGFIGLGAVKDYSAGVVYRHEQTLSGPKKDRLDLLRHTRAHFGQLFMLYPDPAGEIDRLLDEIAQAAPDAAVSDEYGAAHRLWRIADATRIDRIRQLMENKKLLIADGHHRYETALAFHRENPQLAGSDKVMMTFVNMHSPGLKILATHRLVSGLDGFDAEAFLRRAEKDFRVERVDSLGAIQRRWQEGGDKTYIGVAFADKLYLLEARDAGQLDVRVLHDVLLAKTLGIGEEAVREEKNLRYIRGMDAALEETRKGGAQAAFLLKPTSIQQVADISFGGGVMPQKSTDFYPKLLSGLTIYRLG
jgi:uncharacterized protein (DUF1015 family)